MNRDWPFDRKMNRRLTLIGPLAQSSKPAKGAANSNSITVASAVVSSASPTSRAGSTASTIPDAGSDELGQVEDQHHPEQEREPEPDVLMNDTISEVAAINPITATLPVAVDGFRFDANEAIAMIIPPIPNGFEKSNLDEMTLRQLTEDVKAYHYDLAFCQAQLDQDNLTPQEMRTFQLRSIDLGHQIRHSHHRIETLRVQMRGKPLRGGANGTAPRAILPNPSHGSSSLPNGNGAIVNGKHPVKRASTSNADLLLPTPVAVASGSNAIAKRPARFSPADDDIKGTPGPPPKRSRHQTSSSPSTPEPTASNGDRDGAQDGVQVNDSTPGGVYEDNGEGENHSLQRLGYWTCHLCEAPKYLLAGSGRSPAMPCKYPLRDTSKMITHFTEMHSEHKPSERCRELGAALKRNRGPFEYWLRRTRAQNVGDGSCIDECIQTLLDGQMASLLRRFSRAAASMREDP